MTITADTLQRHTRFRTPRRSSLPRKLARIGGGALAAIAILAAAGAAYEQVSSIADASGFLPTGRLVDIGGRKLHLDCRGGGAKTVVMDAGLGGSGLDWMLVQPKLAATTRVCTYDRAGMGWSDPGPQPRSPARLAEELHLLLEQGEVRGPYVLVAHSLAGKTARLFAAAHPTEVAGMVLVDTRSERLDATSEAEAFAASLQSMAMQYSLARRFGLVRLIGGALLGEPLVAPDLATRLALAQTTPDAIVTTTQEGLARAADDRLLAGTTLGSIPLVVIAAGTSMRNNPGWPEAQAALADLSTRGRLVVAENSSHAVALADPNLVIEATLSVIADAGSSN